MLLFLFLFVTAYSTGSFHGHTTVISRTSKSVSTTSTKAHVCLSKISCSFGNITCTCVYLIPSLLLSFSSISNSVCFHTHERFYFTKLSLSTNNFALTLFRLKLRSHISFSHLVSSFLSTYICSSFLCVKRTLISKCLSKSCMARLP